MNDTIVSMLEDRLKESIELTKTTRLGTAEREALDEEISMITTRLSDYQRQQLEYWDKEERRRIEEKKNDEMAKIERNKQKIGWERWAFEFLKLGVTIGTGMYSFFKGQNNMLKFEEHGRITTTAGRELHLPKITWWK